MRCSKTRTLIDDHADGLLPAREAELVRDHLEACAECRDLAFAAKAASVSLARWGDLEPPKDAFAGILARIDGLPPESLARPAFRPARPTLLRRFAMPAGVAAAAALLAVVSMSSFFRTERSPATPANGASNDAVIATASGGGLRPGEVFLARDPDDPALRRRPNPLRVIPVTNPSSPFDVRADQDSPVIPAGFDDFRPVR